MIKMFRSGAECQNYLIHCTMFISTRIIYTLDLFIHGKYGGPDCPALSVQNCFDAGK